MALKDYLGRFSRSVDPDPVEDELEFNPTAPEAEEPTKFVFTDINSEPIGPSASAAVKEAESDGPVRVNNPYDNDRIQTFEINLGGSKVQIPEDEPEETYSIPVEPVQTEAPAAPAAPVVPEPAAEDDYEVDFGYDSLGALDDVVFSKNPTAPKAPAEPEPVKYTRDVADDAGEPDYYDSYTPAEETEYAPKNFFGVGAPSAARARANEPEVPTIEEFPVEEDEYTDTYDAPLYDAVDEPAPAAPAEEPVSYAAEEQPRYENYRKDYRDTPVGEAPRSYENNIDETVFLPDEGDAPVRGKNSRRKLLASIIALLLALLVVLTAVFITHHNARSDSGTATTTSRTSLFAALKDKDKDKTEDAEESTEKTTAFERSVSNNAEATTTTTEAPSSTIGESTTRTSTSRRSSTSSGTTTTTTTASSTASTTTTTAAPTTTTAAPTTATTAAPTTASTTTRTTRDNNPAHSGLNQ